MNGTAEPNHRHIGIKWPPFWYMGKKLAHKKPSHEKQSRNFDIIVCALVAWITDTNENKKCLNYEKLNKV